MEKRKKYLDEILEENGLKFKPDNIYDYDGLQDCDEYRYLCILYANFILNNKPTAPMNSKEIESIYDNFNDNLVKVLKNIISIGECDFLDFVGENNNVLSRNIQYFRNFINKSNKVYISPEVIIRYYNDYYFLCIDDYFDSDLVKLNKESTFTSIIILRDYFTEDYLDPNKVSINME